MLDLQQAKHSTVVSGSLSYNYASFQKEIEAKARTLIGRGELQLPFKEALRQTVDNAG
jgi:hypothetical protein